MKRADNRVRQPRLAAARLVHAVLDQQVSLQALLADGLGGMDDPRQRALAQELTFGTLRWFHRLDAVLAQLLSKPLKQKDHDIRALLLVGLYQLVVLDIPAHAAVSETVEAVRALGKTWAAGLVNAVLRSAQRRKQELLARADNLPQARWSHPQWWQERLREDWPEHWQAILTANNQRPPMWVRVNAGRFSRAHYLQMLADAGIEARPSPVAPHAVELVKPVPVERLPDFASGGVSVQDAAAQLTASLLDLRDGQRVLDACAAPGGKTGHILESGEHLAGVVAIDSEPHRLEKVAENLHRLGLNAELVNADAADTAGWWDGESFDRILLDAPCSASGVVRRHPDIKVLRRADDIPALVQQQMRLLEALWPLLVSGGMLLYVTCSVFRAENADNLGRFLQNHADARESPLDVTWGHPQAVGRQLLPGEHGMDGFYYARLVKA